MKTTLHKESKIPVFLYSKKFSSTQLNDCQNCISLKSIKSNYITLLKENNYLKRQLQNAKSVINNLSNQNLDMQTINAPVDRPTFESEEIIIGSNDSSVNLSENFPMQPFCLVPRHPFSIFDVNKLDLELTYTHELSNRKVKFFGDVCYSYSNIVHKPCCIPSNSYLLEIVNHVKTLFPSYSFNSVLLNKYENGSSNIPPHSDNERCIKPSSSILTVSLGATRTIKFQAINKAQGSELSITLQQGDAFFMSVESQKMFNHTIPRDYSKSMRISLTFRDLVDSSTIQKNTNSSLDSVSKIFLDLSATQTLEEQTSNPDELECPIPPIISEVSPLPQSKSDHLHEIDTIYISSSMFADLDQSKLSSNDHNTAVFYYRGATAGGILRKLKNDSNFLSIDPGKVKQVFLLCGTNDVDNILHIKTNMHSSINVTSENYDDNRLNQSMNDIKQLIEYLHLWNSCTKINVLNLLPRNSIVRNTVINRLNQGIFNVCSQLKNYANFINTEFNVNLFSNSDGHRKCYFFKHNGSDNVHLNILGIVRLGRHLKYLSHLDCSRD